MRTKKLLSFVSIILCVGIIFCTGIHTHALTEVDNTSNSVYTKNKYINNILDFLACVFGNNPSASDGIGDVYRIRAPFILTFVWESPDFFSNIKSILLFNAKVRVLDYFGNFTYVEVINQGIKGYIYYFTIDDDRKTVEDEPKDEPKRELTLSIKNDNVFVGETNKGRLKATYTGNGAITWTIEPEGYIKRDEKTGVITGIKPGIVTVTASADGLTEKCTVSCINKWKEQETASAQKIITIRANPGNTYSSKGKIPKGATITALGDLADGSGWIYIEANGIWGFIQLSDFSGIDYLMTEYHYYDQGYKLRFNSDGSNIYEYASVMNDVMMDLFNLKICPYVSPYTSPADQCKIWRYGSVKSSHLASSCPKTGNHNANSCLTTQALRDALYDNGKGAGNNVTAKAVWTGHIMDGHAMSNSQRQPTYILVFTTGNTVNSATNQNKSDEWIRSRSIYELMHETGHQFELTDHYCKEDGSPCSNNYCYSCRRGYDAPRCIMNLPFNTENYDNDKLFCSECTTGIITHLNDHH